MTAPTMPDGGYRLILADPPWVYRNGGNGRAAAHYDVMGIDLIAAFPVKRIAHDNGILIMWATWPHLAGALMVMDLWGFEYVTGFPWVKLNRAPVYDLFNDMRIRPSWGTGAWVRGASEPILIGRRGKARPPQHHHFMGLISKRMEHSRKPDNIHEYCESLPGPYLEMFARRPVNYHWHVWGNQAPDCAVLPGFEIFNNS